MMCGIQIFVFALYMSSTFAFKFRGSCPDPSPTISFSSMCSKVYNNQNPLFAPVLGVTFSAHRSNFYLQIDIHNFEYFESTLCSPDLVSLVLDPIIIRTSVDNETERYLQIKSHLNNLSMNATQSCSWTDDRIRMWYTERFVLFWSCINMKEFFDEAILVFEIRGAWIPSINIDRYRMLLEDLKPIVKEYISPQLMEYIDWTPVYKKNTTSMARELNLLELEDCPWNRLFKGPISIPIENSENSDTKVIGIALLIIAGLIIIYIIFLFKNKTRIAIFPTNINANP